MNKRFLFSLFFIIAATSTWSAPLRKKPKRIQCEIKPIDRAKIHPGAPVAEMSSDNWSGYVAATNLDNPKQGSVSQVSGRWIVPKLTATKDTTYCAIWVGIDGSTSDTVEQIGTSHDWVNGKQQNYAWFEMYPRDSQEIVGFPLRVGDEIGANVIYVSENTFRLSLTNYTRNVTTIIPTKYTKINGAKRDSAEWVVEAPFLDNVLPLSDFKSVAFTACLATINGIKGAINDGRWRNDLITMENDNQVKAQTSSLSKNGRSFSVKWKHE